MGVVCAEFCCLRNRRTHTGGLCWPQFQLQDCSSETHILHLGFKLKHTLFKKNNEDIYRCSDINVGQMEMVGRGEGMKEKCFLKGNPAPACLQGDPCHPFQANSESG